MSEQFLPIEQQGDTRGPIDQHGNEQPPHPDEQFVGGATDQPDAVDRRDRADQHAQTPAEERQALNERLKARRDADREERVRLYEEQSTTLPEQPLTVDSEGNAYYQEPQQQAPPEEERKHRVRYNHTDIWLTEAEMQRQAQIGMATGAKLEEINRTLAELKQTRDNLNRPPVPAHQAGPRDDRADQERQAHTKGVTDLRKLAEDIQTGDADDGVEALSTFQANILEQVRRENAQASPDDVANRVEQRLQAREADQAFRRYYAERHPELAGHDGLQKEQEKLFHRELIQELRSLRRDDGKMLTDQELMPAVRNPVTALRWVATYALQGVRRSDGQMMANPVQIMDYSGDLLKYDLAQRFAPRTNAEPQAQNGAGSDPYRHSRIREEKRMLSEPRPAQAGQRQGGQGSYQRMTPEQKRSAAVQQRRAATGFDRIA